MARVPSAGRDDTTVRFEVAIGGYVLPTARRRRVLSGFGGFGVRDRRRGSDRVAQIGVITGEHHAVPLGSVRLVVATLLRDQIVTLPVS